MSVPPATKLTLAEALSSARETRALVVGRGVISETARVFKEQFPGSHAVVVADEQTLPLAANAVGAALAAAGVTCVEPFVYRDPALYAEIRFVDQLEASLRTHDAIPVAVGSGTINDLVKLAAHRAGRASYLCVATAASMDGYTAFGASITFQGAKQTFNCPAPRAVVADLDIIRRAPPEMTASGYADLLAKVTAGADWIVADTLGVEPIDPRGWAIVQGGLSDALADPAGARAGNETAIGPLVEGLMLGGFAMQWTKNSRPASGAEHQFSHLWDMEHHTHNGDAPSHGFKVGLATLAVTALYEQLLAQPFEQLDVARCVAAWPDAETAATRASELFAGDQFVDTAVTEIAAKHASPAELERQLQRLRAAWPTLRENLRAQLIPLPEMRRRLQAVGAPTEPEQIGLTRERLRGSFLRAQHIRRRFTVLDLAVRTRTLDASLDAIFGPLGSAGRGPAIQPERASRPRSHPANSPALHDRLREIAHVALDMDGTIYKGGTLFACTLPFLAQMRALGIGCTFLTNNPSKSTGDYLSHLAKMGLTATADELYTSTQATIDHLRTRHPQTKKLFALGTPSMLSQFRDAGFTLTSDDAHDVPDAVVVGFDLTLTYGRACRAAWWIQQGKLFVATNPDRVCPTDQPTVLIDCGSMCAMLEKATGRAPDIVLGKPDPTMLSGILARHSLRPHQIAMVGDRIYTDVLMAHRANAFGVLVLTGEATARDAEQAEQPPHLVVPSLAEFGALLAEAHRRTAGAALRPELTASKAIGV